MPPLTTVDAELSSASRHALAAGFTDMLDACQHLQGVHSSNVAAQLDVGVLLSSFGFSGRARYFFEQALKLAPNDQRARVNLAKLARDAAERSRLDAALKQHCASWQPGCWPYD